MARSAIVVDGRGGLPDEICRQLRRADVVPVQGGPFAADAAEALMGLSPCERPAAVILVAPRTVTVEATTPWRRAGVLHLPVTCDGGTSLIGPLIAPDAGACWRCHALTACDLDAVGAVPLERATLGVVDLPAGPLGILTAAVTASVALTAVAGVTRLSGVSTEIGVGGPTVTHRHWRQHPMCPDCNGPGTTARPRGSQDTMAG